MAHRILIIDNDPTVTNLLSYTLVQKGYEISVSHDGREGLNQSISKPYDLIILEVLLTGMNGIDLVTKMRHMGSTAAVIFLSSKNGVQDIIEGLMAGADDYMTKPFEVAELLARIAATLRRISLPMEKNSMSNVNETIIFGDMQIDPINYEVIANEKRVHLRKKEFELLLFLARRPETIVPREEIINMFWGIDHISGKRTLDVHISLLRKKIQSSSQSVVIASARSIGYKLSLRKSV
ncbi:response regulator transcription factor [Ferviditalea candida]|uniref:Response regulator transcription factor n=1 Tax=Ferviditalea candida TaxID=3108399 RepID=A0ABU5ZM07_9BACL|nr:response regulator transcription factor [Paenibacillaceae bacterium T2]